MPNFRANLGLPGEQDRAADLHDRAGYRRQRRSGATRGLSKNLPDVLGASERCAALRCGAIARPLANGARRVARLMRMAPSVRRCSGCNVTSAIISLRFRRQWFSCRNERGGGNRRRHSDSNRAPIRAPRSRSGNRSIPAAEYSQSMRTRARSRSLMLPPCVPCRKGRMLKLYLSVWDGYQRSKPAKSSSKSANCHHFAGPASRSALFFSLIHRSPIMITVRDMTIAALSRDRDDRRHRLLTPRPNSKAHGLGGTRVERRSGQARRSPRRPPILPRTYRHAE